MKMMRDYASLIVFTDCIERQRYERTITKT